MSLLFVLTYCLLKEKKRIKKKCAGKIEDLELDAIEMQEELQNSIQEYKAKISEINHELDNERIKTESYREELEQVQSNALKQEKLCWKKVSRMPMRRRRLKMNSGFKWKRCVFRLYYEIVCILSPTLGSSDELTYFCCISFTTGK